MTPIEELCKGMPEQFLEFVKYARGLEFKEKPNYDKIIKMFEDCKKEAGFDPAVTNFCWLKILEKEKEAKKQEKLALSNNKEKEN